MAECRIKVGRRDRSVGSEEGEHRRHIWMHHPRTLGAATDGVADTVGFKRRDRFLGKRIGGHDRSGEVRSAVTGRVELWDRRAQQIHWQVIADDSGRVDEHVLGLATDQRSRKLRHLSSVRYALRTGRAVRIAGIDDRSPQGSVRGMRLADLHRRSGALVLRVDGCGRRRPIRDQQRQVRQARFLDSGGKAAGRESLRPGDGPLGAGVGAQCVVRTAHG